MTSRYPKEIIRENSLALNSHTSHTPFSQEQVRPGEEVRDVYFWTCSPLFRLCRDPIWWGCLMSPAYTWGRDWDQEKPCMHGQQARKETRKPSPGPGIEVDMNPVRVLRVGWGWEDTACRASSHGEARGKFINGFYTPDWGTVESMGVILYPR